MFMANKKEESKPHFYLEGWRVLVCLVEYFFFSLLPEKTYYCKFRANDTDARLRKIITFSVYAGNVKLAYVPHTDVASHVGFLLIVWRRNKKTFSVLLFFPLFPNRKDGGGEEEEKKCLWSWELGVCEERKGVIPPFLSLSLKHTRQTERCFPLKGTNTVVRRSLAPKQSWSLAMPRESLSHFRARKNKRERKQKGGKSKRGSFGVAPNAPENRIRDFF